MSMTVLSVLLGLVFTWLVLSLAAMYIQEGLAAHTSQRARMLEATIRNMLVDPVLADQLYNHPLIRSLYTGQDGGHKPSYIPASQFAQALLDILLTASSEAALLQEGLYKLCRGLSALHGGRRKAASKRLSQLLARTRKVLVSEAGTTAAGVDLETIKSELEKIAVDFPPLKAAVARTLDTVRVQMGQIGALLPGAQNETDAPSLETSDERVHAGLVALSITHPRLKQTLQALSIGLEASPSQGAGLLDGVRQNVEEWFNNSMDRLTGWYKRRAQLGVFAIGLVLAVAANVDTLQLANRLWHDPDLSSVLASQAETLAGQDQQSPGSMQLLLLQNQLAGIDLPIGWFKLPDPVRSGVMTAAGDGARGACTLFMLADGDTYGLPFLGQCYPIVNAPPLDDLTGWIYKLIGLFVSGLATAQGAPFWFDILKKIINVRASGANPVEVPNAVG